MTYPWRAASRRSLFLVALAVGGLLSAGCGNQDESIGSDRKAQVEGQTTLREADSGTAAPSSDSSPSGASSGSSAEAADPTLNAILRRAMEQERYSESTYRNILSKVGSVNPFANIVDSEVQHGETLNQLATKYGQDLGSTFVPGEPSPDTLELACQLAATIEAETVSLYDGLLLRVTTYPEISLAFQNLRSASADEHLPAFQKCSAGDGLPAPKSPQGSG